MQTHTPRAQMARAMTSGGACAAGVLLCAMLLVQVAVGVCAVRNPIRVGGGGAADAAVAPHATSTDSQYRGFVEMQVDNFDDDNTGVFMDQFFVDDTYYEEGGAVLYYVSGEYAIDGIPVDSTFVGTLAANLSAVVVTLEHRYYGESIVADELTPENMQFLTVEQALADIAAFIDWYHGASSPAGGDGAFPGGDDVLVIGCSYPGAEVGWFQEVYGARADVNGNPYSLGAVACSGVVNAVYDFYQFDALIGDATDVDACGETMRELTAYVEAQLDVGGAANLAVKQYFGAAPLEDADFLLLLADIFAESVQYGYRADVCDAVTGMAWRQRRGDGNGGDGVDGASISTSTTINGFPADTLLKEYGVYAQNEYYPLFGGPESYDRAYLTNTASDNDDRVWWYQKCSELAYFQTAPAENSVRSARLNTTYYTDLCEYVFDGEVALPGGDTDTFNAAYGGANPATGDDVLYINSSQDPWQEASIAPLTDNANVPTAYVECDNCGHCAALRGCPSLPGSNVLDGCADMTDVFAARQAMQDHLWSAFQRGQAQKRQ